MNEKLKAMIKKAQGDRSQNTFASDCKVSSATITRILSNQFMPSATFLKRLSTGAHNFVTYEDLMKAAGYLSDDTDSEIPTEIRFIARRIEGMNEDDKEQLLRIFNSTIDTFDNKYKKIKK